MITIPKGIRKKYGIKPGTEVAILEIDGNITIFPILSIEELEASRTIKLSESKNVFEEIKDKELELED